VATFVGKMGVASGDIGNCTNIFTKGYHHSRTSSHEVEKVNNS